MQGWWLLIRIKISNDGDDDPECWSRWRFDWRWVDIESTSTGVDSVQRWLDTDEWIYDLRLSDEGERRKWESEKEERPLDAKEVK